MEKKSSFLYIFMTRIALLAIALTVSFKFTAANLMWLGTILGGLTCICTLIMFPILVYNKTHRVYGPEQTSEKSQRGRKCSRIFNWLLFASVIGVGATGTYIASKSLMTGAVKV